MRDSFFTTRNGFDDQLELQRFSSLSCEQLIDACSRRLVKTEGHITAYSRLQRVADICACAYVVPIEKLMEPPETIDHAEIEVERETRRQSWFSRIWGLIVGNPGVVFWTGFFLGLWTGVK